MPGIERVLRERLQAAEAEPAPPSSSGQAPQPGFVAAKAILAGEQKFTTLRVPVLAIYALPHDFGASNAHRTQAEARDIALMTGPQATAFERGIRSARVVRVPRDSHYVFQSNEADVLREMRAFISGLPRS